MIPLSEMSLKFTEDDLVDVDLSDPLPRSTEPPAEGLTEKIIDIGTLILGSVGVGIMVYSGFSSKTITTTVFSAAMTLKLLFMMNPSHR